MGHDKKRGVVWEAETKAGRDVICYNSESLGVKWVMIRRGAWCGGQTDTIKGPQSILKLERIN